MTVQPIDTDPSEAPVDDVPAASGADWDWDWGDGHKSCCVGCFFFCILGLVVVVFAMARSEARSEGVRVDTLAMIRAAEPLCVAIDAYAEQHGRSPASLDVLVPGYVSELPPCRPADNPGFWYEGGKAITWKLTIWGGDYEYTRTSMDEPWFVTGDYDEDYPRERWRAIR